MDHKIYELYKIIKIVEHSVCKVKFLIYVNAHFVIYINKLPLISNDLVFGQRHFSPFFKIIMNGIEKWQLKINERLDSKN